MECSLACNSASLALWVSKVYKCTWLFMGTVVSVAPRLFNSPSNLFYWLSSSAMKCLILHKWEIMICAFCSKSFFSSMHDDSSALRWLTDCVIFSNNCLWKFLF
jgi:hypothetical protein